MYNRLITGLALSISLLLSSSTTSAMQPRVPNTNETVRIIGAAAAIIGLATMAHGAIRRRGSSFLGGLLLLGGGTATALGAERIVEETKRHITRPGFFNRLGRSFRHGLEEIEHGLDGE